MKAKSAIFFSDQWHCIYVVILYDNTIEFFSYIGQVYRDILQWASFNVGINNLHSSPYLFMDAAAAGFIVYKRIFTS